MANIAPKLPEIILCDAVTPCANCGESVQLIEIIQKLAVTNGIGPQATVSIISISDIFGYVFGPEIRKGVDTSHLHCGLCKTCANLLTQLYGLHKLFRERTGTNTFFRYFIKSKFCTVDPVPLQPIIAQDQGTSDSSFHYHDTRLNTSSEPADVNNLSETANFDSRETNEVEMTGDSNPGSPDTCGRPPKVKSLCPQRGKEFNTRKKTALEDHIKFVHEGVVLFSCPICDRPFKMKAHLEAHQKTHLSKEEREALIPKKVQTKNCDEYLCCHCGISLKSKGSLKDHLLRHTDPPKRYQCDHCNKNYGDARGLRRHIRVTHEQEYSPFSCDNCNQRFKVGQQLREHVLFCKKYERPHECQICRKCFKLNHHLELHLHQIHKFTKEEARQTVYPGLPKKNS